jgi:hypothetical protein
MTEHGQKTDNLRSVPLSYSSKMLKNLVEAVRQCKEPIGTLTFAYHSPVLSLVPRLPIL